MRSTARSEVGILCVAGAVGLGIVSMLVPYVWGAFLPSSVPAGQESFYDSLHILWIPLSGLVLVAASAVLLGVGFLFVWRERARVDPERRTLLGLATLAFAAAFAGAVLRTFLGLIVGLMYAPDLRVLLFPVDVGLAIALGLSFYWVLLGIGVGQARFAGIVAIVAGSAGSFFHVLARATGIWDVNALAVATGFLSLTLWLALFLWGYEEVRLRGLSRPPGLPA